MSSPLTVQSLDGVNFDIEIEVAKMSGVLNNMLELHDEGVPTVKVNSDILEKVLDWARHHVNDPLPTNDEIDVNTELPPWDKKFFTVNHATLRDVILAANFLEMKGLIVAACKIVANMIKGKTVEEIRDTFNIKNDFSAEEEANVRKENKWWPED